MPDPASKPTRPADRYARQLAFAPLGAAGQAALGRSHALLVGCGALGSVLANTLVRAGVGQLRVVDRDYLELNNLQRQVLFDEQDVRDGLPKAIAAAAKLARINSDVTVDPIVDDVNHGNIERFCSGVDVILDGTDNFETRFLINDASAQWKIPWVFGGCVGCDGQTMTIIPGQTPCLRCLMLDGPPPPGTTPTCDSAGILAPIVNVIASIQASEAIKLLSGNLAAVNRRLTVFQLWDNRLHQMDITELRDTVDCPVCDHADYEWLEGRSGSRTAVLCGRNAVQLCFAKRQTLDLDRLGRQLAELGQVEQNPFLLRLRTEHLTITAFPDGRAIISGTEDVAEARAFYARCIGH